MQGIRTVQSLAYYPIILDAEELEAVAKVRDILKKHLKQGGQSVRIDFENEVDADGKAMRFYLTGERMK